MSTDAEVLHFFRAIDLERCMVLSLFLLLALLFTFRYT